MPTVVMPTVPTKTVPIETLPINNQADPGRKQEAAMSQTDQIKGQVVDDCVDVEIHIAAPPEAVYEFLVDPEKLLRWMGQEADIDPRPGGRFWLKVGDGTAEGEYVELVAGRRIVLTWGWVDSDTVPPGSTTVTFELEAAGTGTDTGTNVHLVHRGLPTEERAKHVEGWLFFGGRLHIVAEGGDPDAASSTD
jgi:uncharacterized protein YndB with AHSA1/START domain